MSLPRDVTAPISDRLVVTIDDRMASCLVRRAVRAGNSEATSDRSTRMARPVVDRKTRQGVSAISSTAAAALAATVVPTGGRASVRSVRRGVPKRSATSSSSSETSWRTRCGPVSSSSRAAISASNWVRSASSSIRENLVRRRRRSSRMYSAWIWLRSKTSISRARACSVSSLARMTWITSSISRMATSKPSTRCRRSFLRARRNWLRLVTTEMRWSMKTCNSSRRPSVFGPPSTSATLLMLKESSSGVKRYSCSSTASGLKPVLIPTTRRRPCLRSVRSVTSEMPLSFFELTPSLIFSITFSAPTMYGSSVMMSPALRAVMFSTDTRALVRKLPRPVS